jgi:hypothetical protein
MSARWTQQNRPRTGGQQPQRQLRTAPHLGCAVPHRATPATANAARPKVILGDRSADTHDRVRIDRVDDNGKLTLRR